MQKVANLVFNSFKNDSRVEKTSKSLANVGYEVEVIAHLDKGLTKEEIRDNYKIKRFSYLDRKVTKNKLGKLIAYLEYLKKTVNYCKDADILHGNDLNTLPIAFVIKKFYNKDIKVVYDAHEYETEINGLNSSALLTVLLTHGLLLFIIKSMYYNKKLNLIKKAK